MDYSIEIITFVTDYFVCAHDALFFSIKNYYELLFFQIDKVILRSLFLI